VVTGTVVAGVLAAVDGAAVVLEPGPGVVPWLAHPAARPARQAAAASMVAIRVVVIVSAFEPRDTFQNPRLMPQDHKAAGPIVLMRET
jgi:hypothetical protein